MATKKPEANKNFFMYPLFSVVFANVWLFFSNMIMEINLWLILTYFHLHVFYEVLPLLTKKQRKKNKNKVEVASTASEKAFLNI